jgi:hypothetical protein
MDFGSTAAHKDIFFSSALFKRFLLIFYLRVCLYYLPKANCSSVAPAGKEAPRCGEVSNSLLIGDPAATNVVKTGGILGSISL